MIFQKFYSPHKSTFTFHNYVDNSTLKKIKYEAISNVLFEFTKGEAFFIKDISKNLFLKERLLTVQPMKHCTLLTNAFQIV